MTRPRRVLLTADAVGGVWSYAVDLARALAEDGIEAPISLLGPPADEERQGAADGLVVIETGAELDWLAPDRAAVHAAGRRIAEVAGDLGCDIVQLNQPALGADAHFAQPVVAVAHSCLATWWQAVRGGEPPADFAWRDQLTAAGLARADAAVAPTAAHARATAAAHHLARTPHVVHNGRHPLPVREAPLHDFAFTAGRLWDEGKNLATLDRAAGRLGVPFKAAGPLDGPNGERARFEHLHCPGTKGATALAECLAARPVFVSAARYEPFGLAVLEAAQAGCPLVLSDIPSFRELWDGVAEFVPADDDAAFARAIDALVGDPAERVARGRRAAERALRFTPAAMARDMAAIYAAVLARRERAAA